MIMVIDQKDATNSEAYRCGSDSGLHPKTPYIRMIQVNRIMQIGLGKSKVRFPHFLYPAQQI